MSSTALYRSAALVPTGTLRSSNTLRDKMSSPQYSGKTKSCDNATTTALKATSIARFASSHRNQVVHRSATNRNHRPRNPRVAVCSSTEASKKEIPVLKLTSDPSRLNGSNGVRDSPEINGVNGHKTSEPEASDAVVEETDSDAESSDTENMSMVQGFLQINLAAALFGTSTMMVKTVNESGIPPEYALPIRFLIGAAFFTPQIIKGLKSPSVRAGALDAGFVLFVGYVLQAWGLETTTASRGSFALAFIVLTVPFILSFSGRKITSSQWVTSLVALGGVGLLTTSNGSFQTGDAICLIGAVLFGYHKVLVEKYARSVDDAVAFTGVQLLAVAVFSAILAGGSFFVRGGEVDMEVLQTGLATAPWASMAFLGIITTATTLYLEVEAMKVVPVPVAALIYTTEPLWGASFAYMFMGDRWGPKGWVGAALILGASFTSQLLNSDGEEGSEEVAQAE